MPYRAPFIIRRTVCSIFALLLGTLFQIARAATPSLPSKGATGLTGGITARLPAAEVAELRGNASRSARSLLSAAFHN